MKHVPREKGIVKEEKDIGKQEMQHGRAAMWSWNNKELKLQDEWLLIWSEEEIVLLKREGRKKSKN